MKAPECFDVLTQQFDPYVRGNCPKMDPLDAMRLNAVGIVINSVSGTAIAGTRTSGTVFTRTSGVWYSKVIIPISSVTGTYVVGETVTETTSGATGVIEEVTASKMVMKTITLAFTGAETLTGGTSGATSTGGTPVNVITNLKGKLVWSHTSGVTTAGIWCRVVSNTASAVTVDQTLHATGTAIIIVDDEAAAREAMDIDADADEFYSAMQVTAATAATVALTASSGKHQVVIADTGANAVAITLPDARTLKERTQVLVYGKDATTNAITLIAYVAAQTLDGVDISAGGTPLATINADDDYTIIELQNGVWVTTVDGIS